MRKRNMDERVTASQRKVNSVAFGIMMWGILAALLYRQLYLGQDFQDYRDIFAIWLAACAYVTLASVSQGIKPFHGGRVKLLTATLVIAATVLGVNWYLGRVETAGEALTTLLAAFAGIFITIYILLLLYKRWEKRNLIS